MSSFYKKKVVVIVVVIIVIIVDAMYSVVAMCQGLLQKFYMY